MLLLELFLVAQISQYDPEMHFERIGNQTQCFLDDTAVEWVKNIKRSHHVATKYQGNPVIRRDRPWEVWPHFNTTVSLTAG